MARSSSYTIAGLWIAVIFAGCDSRGSRVVDPRGTSSHLQRVQVTSQGFPNQSYRAPQRRVGRVSQRAICLSSGMHASHRGVEPYHVGLIYPLSQKASQSLGSIVDWRWVSAISYAVSQYDVDAPGGVMGLPPDAIGSADLKDEEVFDPKINIETALSYLGKLRQDIWILSRENGVLLLEEDLERLATAAYLVSWEEFQAVYTSFLSRGLGRWFDVCMRLDYALAQKVELIMGQYEAFRRYPLYLVGYASSKGSNGDKDSPRDTEPPSRKDDEKDQQDEKDSLPPEEVLAEPTEREPVEGEDVEQTDLPPSDPTEKDQDEKETPGEPPPRKDDDYPWYYGKDDWKEYHDRVVRDDPRLGVKVGENGETLFEVIAKANENARAENEVTPWKNLPLDWRLILAIIEEQSGFNPNALDRRLSVYGLMQIQKNTGIKDLSIAEERLLDPYANVDGGVRYLRRMMNLLYQPKEAETPKVVRIGRIVQLHAIPETSDRFRMSLNLYITGMGYVSQTQAYLVAENRNPRVWEEIRAAMIEIQKMKDLWENWGKPGQEKWKERFPLGPFWGEKKASTIDRVINRYGDYLDRYPPTRPFHQSLD